MSMNFLNLQEFPYEKLPEFPTNIGGGLPVTLNWGREGKGGGG